MKLHHVAVICSSKEDADLFYEGILGLKKIKTSVLNADLAEQIFGIAHDCQVIQYENEDFIVEVFISALARAKSPTFTHNCLEMKDRDEFSMKCEEKGLTVKRVPKGDSLLIFVEDYDGNIFEIKELAPN